MNIKTFVAELQNMHSSQECSYHLEFVFCDMSVFFKSSQVAFRLTGAAPDLVFAAVAQADFGGEARRFCF